MIVFDVPKVILQSREKVKIFILFDFDHVWSLWTLYVCSGDMCVLLRHGICCVDMLYALWTCLLVGEEYMVSSCGRRICLLVGEEYMDMEDVFLLDKNIWIWKMYSCWIRIYEYGRCVIVGKEYMNMKDVFLLEKNI